MTELERSGENTRNFNGPNAGITSMVRSVRFREATSEDREAITSLHISVSKQTYSGILPADYLTDRMPEEKTRLWERRLAQGIDPPLPE
jgi:hypothetical protein